ncbi:MAG TPA: maltotransferase domain-containing protein, partial [Candidatus Thermoplasmatota archaeon]|nr:maltotransferase domain-containing protein [Candidatus Thermoplasmatota archaeon]
MPRTVTRGRAPILKPTSETDTAPSLPATVPPRAVVEGVEPQVDGGRFPAKRCVGDLVIVEADVLADGHDEVVAVLRVETPGAGWQEHPMEALGNDRYRGAFEARVVGLHR